MQANRYIISNNEEVNTLEEAIKNHGKAYFRIRCESILLSHRGYKVVEIAKLQQVRTHTVRAWMDSWEEKGIAGLQIASGRGRKAAIQLGNTALVEQIQQELQLNPQSLAQLAGQISKSTGLSLSKDQLKRFIKKVRLLLEKVPQVHQKVPGPGKLPEAGRRALPVIVFRGKRVSEDLLWR